MHASEAGEEGIVRPAKSRPITLPSPNHSILSSWVLVHYKNPLQHEEELEQCLGLEDGHHGLGNLNVKGLYAAVWR